jgi:hypothetical protein
MVELHPLQREADVGVNTKAGGFLARRSGKSAANRGGRRELGMTVFAYKSTGRMQRRATWLYIAGGTERTVGKYYSFPMDAITERGYFAEETGILAKT